MVFKEYTAERGAISLLYLYLALVFSLALSIFLSSVFKSRVAAYILSIVIYFVLILLSAFPYIDVYNPLYSLVLSTNSLERYS